MKKPTKKVTTEKREHIKARRDKVVKAARLVHHHVAVRPHEYLLVKSKLYNRWHHISYHRHVHAVLVGVSAVLTIAVIGSTVHQAYALSSWVQSDWSGGVGTSTTNQYSAATNVTTSTANQVTLTPGSQQLANTGFETDTSSWTAGNPNFGSVVALIHADGTNNSTAFTDNSTKNRTITVGGNAVISTAQSKFGGSSASFDGSGDYLSMGPSSDFGFSGDFTVEGWFNATSFATSGDYKRLWSVGNDTGNSLVLNVETNGQLDFRANDTALISSSANAMTTGSWYHVAVSRTSGTLRMFVNGTLVGTAANTTDFSSYDAYPFYVGIMGQQTPNSAGLASSWDGYIDDFEVTKGVGVYAANFTAPTSAQPDFGLVRSTSVDHTGSASGEVIAGNAAANVTQSINVGNTQNYNLSAYAYIDGSTPVTSSYAQLYANGATISTTYTSVGGGWYQLTGVIAGTASSVTYGVQVKALKTVYIDDGSLTDFPTTGTLTSNIFDTTLPSNYGNLSYSATVPSGTTVSVLVRAGNQANLSDASAFTSCSAITLGSSITSACAPTKSRYVQYQLQFTSTGAVTPTFMSITIPYAFSDTTPPPTNASAIAAYRSNGGASITSDGWTNTDPYFSWTAGADDVGGSGLAGYCLYLGQDQTGNPVTTKGDLGISPLNTNGNCQFAVSTANVDTSLSGFIILRKPLLSQY